LERKKNPESEALKNAVTGGLSLLPLRPPVKASVSFFSIRAIRDIRG
jgi:hypothetical protein